MFTYYQVYILHLLDGTKIELAEEYDIPEEKGFIGLYSKAPLDEIIQVGDRFTGFSFIPKATPHRKVSMIQPDMI